MKQFAGNAILIFSSLLTCAIAGKPDQQTHAFCFGGPKGQQFLLDGKPFQIRSGEIDPQRVPKPYWRHRIRMGNGKRDRSNIGGLGKFTGGSQQLLKRLLFHPASSLASGQKTRLAHRAEMAIIASSPLAARQYKLAGSETETQRV